MKWLMFASAVIIICVAHYIRTLRWELFIAVYEKPPRRKLIQALSIGYLLNYFLPYKLGDSIRAFYAGKRLKNGKALGFATVIVDRYLDILAVGFLFLLLAISGVGGRRTIDTTLFYIFLACGLALVTGICVLLKSQLKNAIRAVARIFNNRIESAILQFFWALIWNFKNILIKINKGLLLFYTICMWCSYLLSYYCFADFLSDGANRVSWFSVFTMLFAENGVQASTQGASMLGGLLIPHTAYMTVYLVLPPIILFLLSFLFQKTEKYEREENSYLNLLPHIDEKDRREFLEMYFSDHNRDYIANYLKINQDVSVIRDYSAGSNATTMLCMDGKTTFFRKYAFGTDGDKLYEQICWLEKYKDILPLPEILKQKKTDLYCFYDMPYRSNTVNLFQYVHSVPVDMGWSIIQRAFEMMEKSIYQRDAHPADRETIHRYVNSKVQKNLERIKAGKAIRLISQYETVFINGVSYPNLDYYLEYLKEEYLQSVFHDDTYSVIHGDMTIENIICVREKDEDDFYIIDPNAGNIHDSPNLDYGKMLQSLHGGYEFLMATQSVSVSENRIDFLFTKSSVYNELHNRMRAYMILNFGVERTKSIYFHEIINWLRLMTYKFEKDEKRAMLFYAGLLMVLNDVVKMFGLETMCPHEKETGNF